MVLVPAGPFAMGEETGDIRGNNPRHTVRLSEYWIYEDLVTVAQYRRFCRATGRAMPPAPVFNAGWRKADHPIVDVTWADAAAYAKWAHGELPTEAQWEKAARGTEARKFPWGDSWDDSPCANSVHEALSGTAPSGSFPAGASPYGCRDMAGNVWEWCKDWYNRETWRADHGADPQGPAEGLFRVMRGGSWNMPYVFYFRTSFRAAADPASAVATRGFRIVVNGA
jgi:formylglycine-generating enzyme required for sulfatase activity